VRREFNSNAGTWARQMLQVDVKEADVFGMRPEELD
jgi:hypothetical protein